jgi:HK97 family phage prohead protease
MKPNLPKLPDRESRFLAASIELRAAAEGEEPKKVFGYAAKFNSRSENLGSEGYQFYEVLHPGAFDDVMNDDVRALFNHESSAILARSKNGTGSLQIGIDATGLWYEFEAPDTQVGRDLMTSLKRGDVDQSSFSFTVSKDGQEWTETRDGDGPTIFTRTIKKVSRLYDVSPVTYPAYPDATVALRSLEEFRKQEPETPEPEKQTPSQEELSEVSDWAARFGI